MTMEVDGVFIAGTGKCDCVFCKNVIYCIY